jgi:hypothetical protein
MKNRMIMERDGRAFFARCLEKNVECNAVAGAGRWHRMRCEMPDEADKVVTDRVREQFRARGLTVS